MVVHRHLSGKPDAAPYDGEVGAALREADLAAAGESPRLLRNAYGIRHIIGKTDEQVSNLIGLSSHRTATRLR